nr:hypothetical protein [Tanacetum cinerariifolium]
MEMKDTLSSCSDLDEQEIQQLQKQTKILKENSLNTFNALKTTTQRLERHTFTYCSSFQQAFAHLFHTNVKTFKYELSQNMNNLEKQLNNEILHEKIPKPMVEVPYTAEYNVFAIDTQHYEQPECIINTCVVEKVDSNVIPDSPDMCDNDIQTDQNVEDERDALANLIANLKLDVDENLKDSKAIKQSKHVTDSRIERVQIYSCGD